MSYPIIAIVGRPNTGKSTLFNRLIRQKKAIIDNTPGVTRDRIYGTCTWEDNGFIVIDTGGLDAYPDSPAKDSPIKTNVSEQAHLAVKEADIIIFLMDGKEGLLPLDREIYLNIRRGEKPVLCAVNKIDNELMEKNIPEFYTIGADSILPISASHGTGLDTLMERITDLLPGKKINDREETRIRLAIIGRPNVGKSSLLNKILRQERALVNNTPGTTRDCIDTLFNYNYRSYTIIDTAGLRRRTKSADTIERISIIKTIKNIENCQIALLLLDASEGIIEQDVHIAGIAHQAGKGIVIIVNKWDKVVKDDKTMKRFEEEVRLRLKYISFAPVIFVSALTGQRVYKIFDLIETVYDQYNTRVTTGILNRAIKESIERMPPPRYSGKSIKIYYHIQIGVQPPTFIFFTNYPQGIKPPYQRYLQNQIRERLGLSSTPLRIIFRQKQKEK